MAKLKYMTVPDAERRDPVSSAGRVPARERRLAASGYAAKMARFGALCLAGFLCAAAAGVTSLALAGAASRPTVVLTVSTTADVVNGNVSSPAALIAHPGPGGISLREAITAANHASGHVKITFARALAGKTLTPKTYFPAFTHGNTALIGLTTNGQPAVTIDGARLPGRPVKPGTGMATLFAPFNVYASNVSIMHLHITDVHNSGPVIFVSAAQTPRSQHQLSGDQIEFNILDPGSYQASGPTSQRNVTVGIALGTFGSPGAVKNGSVINATIAHNVIRGFSGDGIGAGPGGVNCSVKGLLIEDNTFANLNNAGNPAVELSINFSHNSITGTRILRNTFTGNWAALGLTGSAQGDDNVLSNTLISQNVFDGNSAALDISLTYGNGKGNAVLNTTISNNIFTHNEPHGALGIGGAGGNSNNNRIDGLQIVNDTFAFNDGALVFPARLGSNNQALNVKVQNSIFWMNGSHFGDMGGPAFSMTPLTIITSLIGVDPLFVSAQDVHLQAGSPAINAGTASGAPTVDIDNGLRDSSPDIGAYEFGAAPRP